MLQKRPGQVLATLAVLSVICAARAGDMAPDFRAFQWYSTLEQVRKEETAAFLEYRAEELNIAVSPPKPWKTEHLYFRDTLLNKPVRILYRFDIGCQKLFEASYIFDEILNERDLTYLIEAIETKYEVKLKIDSTEDGIYAGVNVTPRTAVLISQKGMLHFHANVTVVTYQTTNYHWLGGWNPGTAPTCEKRKAILKGLQEHL